MSDHGLSAMVGEDCALWRVVAGRKICRDDQVEPGRPVVAEAVPDLPKAPALAEAGADETLPERAPEPASLPEGRRFLVLGSFINQDNAKHLAASLDGVDTAVIAVGVNGTTFHRVVAGPLDDAGIKALSERMVLEARARPWETSEPAGEAPSIGTATARATTRDATALLRRQASVPPPI